LIEKTRLPLDQHPEAIAITRVGDRELVALPIRELRNEIAIERVGDVIGARRWIVRRLHCSALWLIGYSEGGVYA